MNREIRPAENLQATLQLPPDKSISHRAALFGSLYEGTSHIRNFSGAADPQTTLSCLEQLGVTIDRNAEEITIQGVGRSGFQDPDKPLDCGNSGTTMRLLSGIVGGAGVNCTLTGDDSLSTRTMKRIIDPLRAMDIEITGRNGNFSPLHIKRTRPVKALHFVLPIPSAQLKSCVLLAGLFGEESTEVIEKIPSRDHTERLLGLPVEEKDNIRTISSNDAIKLPGQSYRIPGDFSAAAFWLVAGSIQPRASITLDSVGVNPTRTAALHILQQMGADIHLQNKRVEGAEPVAELTVQSSRLKPIDITEQIVPNCIDEIPILVIAMLFADGTSRISGAGELRHKETDRLSALADILRQAGAEFKEFEDGMEIHGSPDFQPQSARYQSFHDHRIAMSAAVLALKGSDSSQIIDAECTDISYPGFWDDLAMLTN